MSSEYKNVDAKYAWTVNEINPFFKILYIYTNNEIFHDTNEPMNRNERNTKKKWVVFRNRWIIKSYWYDNTARLHQQILAASHPASSDNQSN